MIKQINVCKYCNDEISTGDLCSKCLSIYGQAHSDALKEISAKIGAIAEHQNAAFNIIESNDSIAFWGSNGIKWRNEILDAFKKHMEK